MVCDMNEKENGVCARLSSFDVASLAVVLLEERKFINHFMKVPEKNKLFIIKRIKVDCSTK